MAGSDTQIFDQAAVQSYLRAQLLGSERPMQVTKFEGGQSNPTFLLKRPAHAYVPRRKPSGVLLKSAHAVDHEFRVQTALQGSDVPVSRMHLLCEDDSVIGSLFYMMNYVEGRNLNEPAMPDVGTAEHTAIIDEVNRVMDALAEQQPDDDGQRTLVHGDYQIDNFCYHLGFAFFRMAAIIQGVLKQALDGNASTPRQALKRG